MNAPQALALPSAAPEQGGASLALRTQGLTKRFGTQVVVDDLNLAVPTGAVYGFLGPNGSGKTTTIRMLLGLVNPSSGHRWLLDRPIPQDSTTALARVGALVEGPAFHPYLSARANLARVDAADATAQARTARRRIDAALERVGLTAAADKKYRAYSLGMKQRLGIAAALLQERDLLILDEPTNGLDPQGTREIRSLVADLAADGTTVFISSHLLAEVEQMCSHLGVMSKGVLVAQDTVGNLRSGGRSTCRVQTADVIEAIAVLTGLGLTQVEPGAGEPDEFGHRQVLCDPGQVAPEKILSTLVQAQVPVSGFTVSRPTLEELFVALTGDGFNVSG